MIEAQFAIVAAIVIGFQLHMRHEFYAAIEAEKLYAREAFPISFRVVGVSLFWWVLVLVLFEAGAFSRIVAFSEPCEPTPATTEAQ